jgi:hypothetical protein
LKLLLWSRGELWFPGALNQGAGWVAPVGRTREFVQGGEDACRGYAEDGARLVDGSASISGG